MRIYLRGSAIALCAMATLLFSILSAKVNAVELTADGIGDVLIMPYYTVRDVKDREGLDAGTYQSFINISNISSDTVAIQVKFLEAQHGRLCRKINVVLSPHDAWAAAIQPTASGVRLFTVDNSCTSPQMTASGNGTELPFNNIDFGTSIFRKDVGPSSIDRCKEGFIEVFALGRSAASNSKINGTIANNAKHTDDEPKNCDPVHQAFTQAGPFSTMKTEFKEPTNSLKATYTLLNVANGIAYGGEFVALANFYSPDVTNGAGADGTSNNDLLPNPISLFDSPTLNSANPKESVVRIGSGANLRTLTDTWNRGVDAVSAVLARSQAMNQWTTNTNLGAETAWVATMPTFEFYTSTDSIPPFQDSFAENTAILDPLGLPQGGACNRIAIKLYDRHENLLSTRFTPANTGSSPLLCYAANPITFNGGNLMGSTLARNINADDARNGWMNLSFLAGSNRFFNGGGLGRVESGAGSNASEDIYAGLPVVAVSFTIRAQGSAGTNFGTLWQHSYQRDIGLRFVPPIIDVTDLVGIEFDPFFPPTDFGLPDFEFDPNDIARTDPKDPPKRNPKDPLIPGDLIIIP